MDNTTQQTSNQTTTTQSTDTKPNSEHINRGNSADPKSMKNKSSSNRGPRQKSQKRKIEDPQDPMNKKFTRKWDGQTRRDKNVDTRSEVVEDGEKEERRPKKKVACFIGYSGEGYHGMQLYGIVFVGEAYGVVILL